ncbi:methylmalonate-semialdehyde dehydrogenase [Pseudomonas aeruginosa VRFPA09]|nr:methylmalonate-semialdehyde dehydrogenase [Pseudomonas aeruginosa VRFPA09]
MAKAIPQLIDGEWRGSRSRELIEVTDPATQDVLALAPKATADEIEQAIASAQRAFETWREVPAPERARLMLRYQHLLKEHHDELGELLARETGKNLADAKGDVWRGIEVVEHAANVASLMMGETVENVAREIDTASWIQPLGVCAGITPFNFPAMIPLWMFPLAIACGNTFVLKPSEQDPLTPNRLAELFLEAGAPKGVLQVIHGGREQVDALLTHPDIRAISFVGSVAVGQHVYRTGTAHLKRVQAFAGAKNHMVILPDANKAQVLGNLVGASCGAAGQRCMAISAAVFVGAARESRARREGDEYVLDGSKCFISGAGSTQVLIVMARTGEDGARGISCFLVPADAPGIRYGRNEDKMGWRAQPTRTITFEGVRIPAGNRIGPEGQGFVYAMKGLDGGRLNIASCSLGAAQAALEQSMRYVEEREQFGKPLATFQALQFKLADMLTELTASRQMVRLGAHRLDRGDAEATLYCAMAKRFATDRCFDVCNEPCNCTAATAISTIIRWSAGYATPACTRSSKAPTKSCG